MLLAAVAQGAEIEALRLAAWRAAGREQADMPGEAARLEQAIRANLRGLGYGS